MRLRLLCTSDAKAARPKASAHLKGPSRVDENDEDVERRIMELIATEFHESTTICYDGDPVGVERSNFATAVFKRLARRVSVDVVAFVHPFVYDVDKLDEISSFFETVGAKSVTIVVDDAQRDADIDYARHGLRALEYTGCSRVCVLLTDTGKMGETVARELAGAAEIKLQLDVARY